MTTSASLVVVDASVAVKWHLLDEEHADRAALLLRRFAARELRLLAPDYFSGEVASAITAATLGRSPRLTPAQGRAAIDEFLRLRIPTVPSGPAILGAYDLVQQVHCAFYDALYLAVAHDLGVPLITADRRFFLMAIPVGGVIWLGSYV